MMNDFGKQLESVLIRKGFTTKGGRLNISRAAREIGMDDRHMGALIRGEHLPSRETLERLQTALGVVIDIWIVDSP